MGLIEGDRSKLREEEPRVEEQTMKVAALEDDGVVTTTYNSISNTLYDLADQNSKTTRVVLPQGTTISLAATSKPGLGSYRATYEVAAKEGMPQTAYGTQAATDLAYKLDLLQLPEKDRKKLLRLSEEELIEEARRHLPRLEEKRIQVSGYVTKSGKHVGAYSQIRTTIAKLGMGDSVQFPDGITVRKLPVHSRNLDSTTEKFEIRGGSSDYKAEPVAPFDVEAAAKTVSARTARSRHPRSVGGSAPHSKQGADIDGIPVSNEHNPRKAAGKAPGAGGFIGPMRDNPKLPGTPHPEDVAKRAAAGRKAAKLPSRKERAENERKAGERSGSPFAPGGSLDSDGRRSSKRPKESDEVKRKRAEDDAEADRERGKIKAFGDQRRRAPNEPTPDGIRRSEASTTEHLNRLTPGQRMEKGHGVSVTKAKDGYLVRGGGADKKHTDPGKAARDATVRWLRVDEPGSASRLIRETGGAAANIDREKSKREKTVAKHPAAKARRRHKGLAESAFFGN